MTRVTLRFHDEEDADDISLIAGSKTGGSMNTEINIAIKQYLSRNKKRIDHLKKTKNASKKEKS